METYLKYINSDKKSFLTYGKIYKCIGIFHYKNEKYYEILSDDENIRMINSVNFIDITRCKKLKKLL